MKKLLVFLRDYKKESVLAPLFKLLEASFELFVPLVMAKIIDVGIGTGDNSYVLKMCGVLILFGIYRTDLCDYRPVFCGKRQPSDLRQNCVMHCLNIYSKAVF